MGTDTNYRRLTGTFVILLCCIPGFVFSQKTDSVVLKNSVLYYYTYGKGQPIILLSGGPGFASNQEDDVAQQLSKNYKAILFDQRGTGKSWTYPFDSTTINLDTAVADIEKLREHLKIGKLNLYGHSWGSTLGAAYIKKYPDKVNLFIVVGGGELDTAMSTIIGDNYNLRFQLLDTNRLKYWTDSSIIKKDPQHASMEVKKLYISTMIYDSSKLDLAYSQVSRGHKSSKMADLMDNSLIKNGFNLVDAGKRYKGDALIIFGWNDPIGLTTVSQYISTFPKAKIAGIAKCGHLPEVEQPKAFYSILNSFLEQHLHKSSR
jgi:proline iminopeptidase